MGPSKAVLCISESKCSTAALLEAGTLVACASEERFTRQKNTGGFPSKAIEYVLRQGGVKAADWDAVVFSNESPPTHFFYSDEHATASSSLLKKVAVGAMDMAWVDWRPLKRLVDRGASAWTFPGLR